MKRIICIFLLAFMMIMPNVSAEIIYPSRSSGMDLLDIDIHEFYQHILEANTKLDESERFICSELAQGEDDSEYVLTLLRNGLNTEVYIRSVYSPRTGISPVLSIAWTAGNNDDIEGTKNCIKAMKLLFLAVGMQEKQFTRVISETDWHKYMEYNIYNLPIMGGRYMSFYDAKIRKPVEIMFTVQKDERKVWILYREYD